MAKKIILNKKAKRKEDRKKISGTRWQQDDDYILACYQRYKDRKISAETLLDLFPGRTFHAIFSKVYAIRGSRRVVHKKNVNPAQYELPFGGQLESKR